MLRRCQMASHCLLLLLLCFLLQSIYSRFFSNSFKAERTNICWSLIVLPWNDDSRMALIIHSHPPSHFLLFSSLFHNANAEPVLHCYVFAFFLFFYLLFLLLFHFYHPKSHFLSRFTTFVFFFFSNS